MAKDKYHDLVKEALIAEGCTITEDPLIVPSLISTFEIDLGAERILTAEKGTEKIAVEIKSFIGSSVLHDFFKAVGQFAFYYLALKEAEPDRELYLAIPDAAYEFLFRDPNTNAISKINKLKFIVYNINDKNIKLWAVPSTPPKP